jgi:3-hydroxyisobutyrate dehydrogenase-like beta-hydroxyacid dehydrogenase
MRVGFVGLGLMGAPMAQRLLQAGHNLTVTSRRRESALELEANGARWAPDAAACAEGMDATILMLPDVGTVEAIALGEDGTLAGRTPVLIDMSTTAPALSERIAQAASGYGTFALDAPVSGGPAGAQAGTLSIMVGGDAGTYESMQSLLEAMGTPRLLGPAGAGQRAKLVNQVLVAATGSGIAEAWALASALGLDLSAMQDVLAAGIGGGPLLAFMWPRLVGGDLAPGFKIEQMIKDLRLAVSEAESTGIDLAAVDAALRRYADLSNLGDGALGTQALVRHPALRRDSADRNTS